MKERSRFPPKEEFRVQILVGVFESEQTFNYCKCQDLLRSLGKYGPIGLSLEEAWAETIDED